MMTTEQRELIAEIIRLDFELEETDSRAREQELKEAIVTLDGKSLNGAYVETADGKRGRIWHTYFGSYHLCGNSCSEYRWSQNMTTVRLSTVIFMDEPDVDWAGAEQIDEQINTLENKISRLKKERIELIKDHVCCVDPDSFEDTEEINRAAVSFVGVPVYIQEAHCDLCGKRITS